MGKIKIFIKKYKPILVSFLGGIFILLGILTLLKFTNIANISIYIKFKNIILAWIIDFLALISVTYTELPPKIQKLFNITFHISLFILLIIQFLPLLGIDISISIPTSRIFLISNYSKYINLLIFLILLTLCFFNNQESPHKNNILNKKKNISSIIFLSMVFLYLLVEFSLFRYSGNYPDEYHHLISGQNLINKDGFPKLNMYFDGSGYLKGSPVSYMVAFFFFLFGVNLPAGKLVPITLGLLGFLLLNQISKKMIKNKIIRIFPLLFYIFSPWLIFNHFYIRHYVFLEFSLILIVFLFMKLSETIEKNKKKSDVFSIFIISYNLLFFFMMNDSTKYLIPFSSIWGLIYIFQYKNFTFKKKILTFLRKIKTKKLLKWISLIIILCIGIYFTYSNNLLSILFDGETNTASTHYNVYTFFFGLYSFFSIFAFIGFLITILKKNTKKFLIYYMFIPLFLLHALSSESMQIMRGLVYLLPLFFILSCYGFEQIMNSLCKSKISIYISILLFSIFSIQIFLKDITLFFPGDHPIFPKEIGYSDYKTMYNYVNNELGEYTIIYVGYNDQPSAFWNTEINYKLDFKHVSDLPSNYSTYYDKEKDIYRQYYTNTPIIIDRKNYLDILNENKVCIILSSESSAFLLDSDIYRIEKNLKLTNTFEEGYQIYCEE